MKYLKNLHYQITDIFFIFSQMLELSSVFIVDNGLSGTYTYVKEDNN